VIKDAGTSGEESTMKQVSIDRVSTRIVTAGVLVMLAIFTAGQLEAQQSAVQFASAASPERAVTFTADVMPILQQNCQVCHQAGGIGPMSLMTYQEVRRWSSRIKQQVVERNMPPYQYDTDFGIQDLQYDARLSEEEIQTIADWVDSGMAEGDPADMPPPVDWPDPADFRLAEQFGPPDVIVRSEPYSVPASGQDRWWQPVVESGITSDRCIRAIETKPSVVGRAVTHHANSSWRGDGSGPFGGGGQLSEYALGKLGEIIPEGACRTAPANGRVAFDIHYWPNGVEVIDDQVEVGIWFYPEDYEGEYRQTLSLYFLNGGRGFDIAPHGTLMTQGFHQFETPVRIDSWQPHGHTRLVAMSLQILRANGRTENVSMVSNWSALWHHSHIYEENVAPLLDVGDKLLLTGWYDNTENNKYNPDPDQWVGIGDRTADEMSHAWIAVTHLDEEGYQELLQARQRPPVSEQQQD
jgi:mono/diheme cytochrome c family protein